MLSQDHQNFHCLQTRLFSSSVYTHQLSNFLVSDRFWNFIVQYILIPYNSVNNTSLRDVILCIFFNWDSLHARLNSQYEAQSYKKRSTKKITRYRKSVQKKPTVKGSLLSLDLKPLRSQVKGKHCRGREFQSLAVRGKKLLTQTSL